MNENVSITENKFFIWEEKNLTEPAKKLENNGGSVVCDTTGSIKYLNVNEHSIGTTKEKISGIYKIINKVNGKYYVGSSINIKKRFVYHKSPLRHNKHYNEYLQRAWNKYGENNFEFIIIEKNIPEKFLIITEQKYLDIAKTEKNKCYNLSFTANHSEMTFKTKLKIGSKIKLRFSNKINHPMFGKHHTDESKTKIRLALLGEKNHFYGKHHTEKSREQNRQKKLANKAFGPKSGHYNYTIYNFYNKFTSENFTGTAWELYTKYNLSQNKIVLVCQNIRNHHKGWTLKY